jgi:hypothetical protein
MQLPDGVYIGLNDDRYFAQDRLGSTDLVVLHKDPSSWWYGSRLNPSRQERERTEELDFGSALHALVLEGEDVYSIRCAIRPDTYIDAKTGEEKKWHGGAGPCKEWMELNDRPDRLILTEDADRRVRHMAELILNHPELGAPMRGGLSEVSVFWTGVDGVRLRARFDKLLPRFIVDLKTFGGDAKGRTVKQQCLGLVAQRDMDVQRYLYFVARQKMAELIDGGHLVGGNAHEREWITKAAAIEDWRWCWIFYRRRDDRRPYAPVVKPILRSHLDVTFDTGRRKVEVALQNFLTFRERFADIPWAIIEPTEEPDDHEFPSWLADVCEPVAFREEEDAAA